MVNGSKGPGKSSKSTDEDLDNLGARLIVSVPSSVYMKIRKSGKLEKFHDAVSNNGIQFAFDIEQFCKDTGIELSKKQRELCALEFEKLGRYFRPRLVK